MDEDWESCEDDKQVVSLHEVMDETVIQQKRAKFFASLFEKGKEYSDVTFEIHESDDGTEHKMNTDLDVGLGFDTIDGIRLLFASQSDIFQKMLFGSMLEASNRSSNVVITDIDYNTFLWLKKYIYGLRPNLTDSNIVQVLKMADKYIIEALYDACINCIVTKFMQVSDIFINILLQLNRLSMNRSIEDIVHHNEFDKCMNNKTITQIVNSPLFLEMDLKVITLLFFSKDNGKITFNNGWIDQIWYRLQERCKKEAIFYDNCYPCTILPNVDINSSNKHEKKDNDTNDDKNEKQENDSANPSDMNDENKDCTTNDSDGNSGLRVESTTKTITETKSETKKTTTRITWYKLMLEHFVPYFKFKDLSINIALQKCHDESLTGM